MEEVRDKVQVMDLSKNFGDLKVLENCNFSIRQGEFVCVVGPTGCGKTTFLNLLCCLIKPTSGKILIDGEEADPKNIIFPLCSRNRRRFHGSRWSRTCAMDWN